MGVVCLSGSMIRVIARNIYTYTELLMFDVV